MRKGIAKVLYTAGVLALAFIDVFLPSTAQHMNVATLLVVGAFTTTFFLTTARTASPAQKMAYAFGFSFVVIARLFTQAFGHLTWMNVGFRVTGAILMLLILAGRSANFFKKQYP